MYQSSAYFAGTFAAQQYPAAGYSAGASGDPNLYFLKQTLQEPLQYGMASYGGHSKAAAKSFSSASTERWPSDEHYVHSSNGSLIAPDASSIAGMLPIRELRHVIELERRIVSVQQYECLVLTIRYQGSLSEMLRNFITDPVLGRIAFIRTKHETCDCAMKTDLQRIMMAIKASWFPDKNQECFEAQIAQLLKNSHARCMGQANNDVEPQPGSPTSSKGPDQPTVNSIKAEYQQTAMYPPQNPVIPAQNLYLFQQNQWYQYALYYRDRYQIARKANQKMKAEYAEQEKEYRKRISGCQKRVRAMQQYLNILEERVQQLQ